MPKRHGEIHHTHRSGWLRAAVMGANDGIVSTASLLVGVAAAESTHQAVILAGVAGLVAGAMSMAAGEYVSVSSQADIESADLAREQRELEADEEFERAELAGIYQQRGLDESLSREVAEQLMAHDALAAHARDELGISHIVKARPIQAALTSAVTFAVGAALPLAVAWFAPLARLEIAVALASLLFLAGLGTLAAYTGGAHRGIGALRVTFWGALAMAATAWIGDLVGKVL
ncbi:MAG: VIT family protein [Pseudomonadales bacterium]